MGFTLLAKEHNLVLSDFIKQTIRKTWCASKKLPLYMPNYY